MLKFLQKNLVTIFDFVVIQGQKFANAVPWSAFFSVLLNLSQSAPFVVD
jgi:hypothetical protein